MMRDEYGYFVGHCLLCGCEPGYPDGDCAGCDSCHPDAPVRGYAIGIATGMWLGQVFRRAFEMALVLGTSYLAVRVAMWAAAGFPVVP